MAEILQPRQEIRLIGVFLAIVDGAPMSELSAPRAQSLLAYLILHADAPQSRQQLAYELWPDSTEKQARTNLRKVVHQVRSLLPSADDCLWVTRSTLQWNPFAPYSVDVLRLEQLLNDVEKARLNDHAATISTLEKISDLYTGDLMPSCYDDWISPFRSDLRRRVLTALSVLADRLEAQRDYDRAIVAARLLTEIDPLDEDACRRSLRLHLLRNDRSAAITVYQQYSERLREELDVEPDVETQAMYERLIVAQPPDKDNAQTDSVADTNLSLIGRDREWQMLQTAWRQAASGEAQLIVIKGEAGIGKSRLAQELLTWVRKQGIRAERTRSYSVQGALAYAPIAELLKVHAFRDRLTNLEPLWQSEISRLAPDLLVKNPGLPVPQPMAESWQRQRFFDALTRAVWVEDAPLLLLFDDLQWCDRETLEWIGYLLNQMRSCRLLVLGTLRADEVDDDHPYIDLETSFAHESWFTSIPLLPLNSAETQKLASQVAGYDLPDDRFEQLYGDTEGNPLFIVETIRAQDIAYSDRVAPEYVAPETDVSIARLPSKVHSVIRSRLTRLSPRTRELANLAAVVGHSFTYDVLHYASEQDAVTLADGLDELLRRQIIVETRGDSFDFSHDRIRDVAYADISRVRRRLLHDSVAQTLLRLHKDDIDSVSGELAEHFLQAGRKQEATNYLCRSGIRSVNQYSNREALQYFARARDLLHEDQLKQRYTLTMHRLDVIERIRDTLHWKDEMDELERIVAALDGDTNETTRRRADLALRRANYAYQVGDPHSAIGYGRLAMELAESIRDQNLDYMSRATIGIALWSMGELQESKKFLLESLVLADQAQNRDLSALLMSRTAAVGMFSSMPCKEIRSYLQQLLAISLETGNVELQADAYNKLGYLAIHGTGTDYEAAMANYAIGLELATKLGNTWLIATAESNLGYLYVLMGDHATAAKRLDHALDLSAVGMPMREGATLVNMGYERRNRGDYDHALEQLQRALDVLEFMRLPQWVTWAHREQSWIYRARGDYEQAENHARQSIDMARVLGDERQEGYALMALGRVMEYLERSDADMLFRQSYKCLTHMVLHNRSMAPLAGMARVAKTRGDDERAERISQQIVNHLSCHELDKTEEGFRVYVACYDILHSKGDPQAAEVLSTVQRHLCVRADSLSDVAQQRLFWEMPDHRRIRDTVG